MKEYADQNPPSEEGKAHPQDQVDKALILQMDQDFQELMSEDPNRDPIAAYQDVCASNLGHLVQDNDGEDRIFFHQDHDSDV